MGSKYCHRNVVELILQELGQTLGADDIKEYINMRNEDGYTSVHFASQIPPNEHKEEDAKLVGTLIDYGGQTEVQTHTVCETQFALKLDNFDI